MYFDIEKATPLIIYGAGEFGRKLRGVLEKNGYFVKGYFDKNLKVKANLPVFDYRQEIKEIDKNRVVVIISLSNGMLHNEIADILYKKGYHQICFLPLTSSSEICLKMVKKYNYIIEGIDEGFKEIPRYDAILRNEYVCEDSIIRRDKEKLTVWVNHNILYTLNKKNWKDDKTKLFSRDDSYDRPLATFKAYIDLFRCFETGQDKFELYMQRLLKKYKGDSKKAQQDILEREDLYNIYKRRLNYGMGYFIDVAPNAIWNNKGYFNMMDGHHRLIFQYVNHITNIPIRISIQDWEMWCNREVLEKVKQYMVKYDDINITVPIEHPYFLNLDVRKYDSTMKIMDFIYETLGTSGLEYIKILDASGYQGFIARGLRRIARNSKIVCIDKNKKFIQLINELLYQDNIVVEKNIKDDMFDLIIVNEGANFGYNYSRYLFKNTKTTIIYIHEVNTEAKFEKIFSKQQEVLHFYEDGKCMEVAIYTKGESDEKAVHYRQI